jgi:hypothetical protein
MSSFGRFTLGVSCWLAAAGAVGAAEIAVPLMELATTGVVAEDWEGKDRFILGTHATAEVAVVGGYKFGGTLRFSFAADDLERALSYSAGRDEPLPDGATVTADEYNYLLDRMNNSSALSFELAKVDIRDPFGLPVEFSYFVGEAASFCSGDDFSARFGTASIASDFRGLAYFPTGIGGDPSYQYDGIHGVTGTGVSIALTSLNSVVPIFYAYQDSAFGLDGLGRYSFDARLLANGERVKFEAFAGATAPYGASGLYRGGLLAHFSTGTGPEFMAQIGVPRWDPEEEFQIDNLYFLFEPRVDFGFLAIVMTLFYHPAWYLQRETGESGVSDVNLKLLIGDLRKSSIEGGIETTLGVRGKDEDTDDTFRLAVGPFFGAVTEGVRWDFKVRIHPIDYDEPIHMFETFLGVRTAF